MPLPKIPTKPATILLAKDYPRAEPGNTTVRAAAKAENDPVEDLISGPAVGGQAGRARHAPAPQQDPAPGPPARPPPPPRPKPPPRHKISVRRH
jgi:PhoH-like ATPase